MVSKKRTKREKKTAAAAVLGFDSWYEDTYRERWVTLKKALLEEASPVAFSGVDGSRLQKPYYLDEASIWAAQALETQAGEKVLDMCAAPGGKSLVLALETVVGSDTSGILLTCNDRSASRRARLHRVIQEHLSPEIASFVQITGHDASRWGLHEQNIYDRILLDAPCSSERHVLSSPEHLAKWSLNRSKSLATQAFAMLAAGLEALKPGGTLLYSTCALSPLENDGVIEKLHKKRPGLFEQVDVAAPEGEKTTYGWMVLPDTCGGRGPIYMSKIVKR